MTLKRWTYVIGFLMVGIMGFSAIMPAIRTAANNPQPTAVVPTAVPTFPPPPDTNTISFDQTYLHPSGLFTVAEPTGWTPSQPQTTSTNVRAVFADTAAQGVIQVDVDQPGTSGDTPLTLDNVDAQFNQAWLQSSWRSYSSWEESSRERTSDERLVIDFALTSNGQTFVARQKAWTDGEWIYSVRVVMPENATDTLLYLLDGVAASLQPMKEFAGTPFDWKAYFDQQDTHLIRFPSDWTLADSAPGKPTSIEGADNTILRVEADPGTAVDSEDAARSWVGALRTGINILSVAPVSREGTEGYSVAYAYQTVDGDTESGLAVLLNGPEDKLHVANVRFPGNDVDLNAPEPDAAFANLTSVMNSFVVLPELAGVQTDITTSATSTSG